LEGLEAIDHDILFAALKDQHPQIRKAAIVLSEPFIKKDDAEVMARVADLKNDASADVRLQLFYSLYSIKPSQGVALAQSLLAANTSNDIYLASQKAIDRNNDIRVYGSRLAGLPAEERSSILAGSAIFNSLCVTCHGPGGKGIAVAGSTALAAPPLAESKRMNADKSVLIKIVMHGLTGPVEGKEYPSVMPSLGANSDEWVASVVNYVRYEFGTAYRRFRRPGDTTRVGVSIQDVAAVRAQYANRTDLWTLAELETGVAAAPAVDSVAKTTAIASGKKPTAKPAAAPKKGSYAAVQKLLLKNTCLSCHNPTKKVIGPSYEEIAKRKYTVAQIVQLIQKPNPSNWPGYATKMPSMAHVSKAELTQIATWIKSLQPKK
jgi:mono/diheme cytochrome c family protein